MSSVGHHHELAPGVDAWRFEYCEPRRRQAGFADGLEIFLQLEGDFGLGTPLRPTTRQRFRPGELMVLDSGEAYRHAAEGLGRQVGFTIRPDQLAPLCGTTDDVHMPAGANACMCSRCGGSFASFRRWLRRSRWWRCST